MSANIQWPIGPMSAADWNTQFVLMNGREATAAEYNAAGEIGHIIEFVALEVPQENAAPAQNDVAADEVDAYAPTEILNPQSDLAAQLQNPVDPEPAIAPEAFEAPVAFEAPEAQAPAQEAPVQESAFAAQPAAFAAPEQQAFAAPAQEFAPQAAPQADYSQQQFAPQAAAQPGFAPAQPGQPAFAPAAPKAPSQLLKEHIAKDKLYMGSLIGSVVASLLGFIALFLPVWTVSASGEGLMSSNWFGSLNFSSAFESALKGSSRVEEAIRNMFAPTTFSLGLPLLLIFLVLIALSVLAWFKDFKNARLVLGEALGFSGLLVLFLSFSAIGHAGDVKKAYTYLGEEGGLPSKVSELINGGAGAGAFLMIFVALLFIAAAVLVLLPLFKGARPVSAGVAAPAAPVAPQAPAAPVAFAPAAEGAAPAAQPQYQQPGQFPQA